MAGTYIHLKLFTITWLPLAIVLIDMYFKKVLFVLIHYRVLFVDQSRKQEGILMFNPCYFSYT